MVRLFPFANSFPSSRRVGNRGVLFLARHYRSINFSLRNLKRSGKKGQGRTGQVISYSADQERRRNARTRSMVSFGEGVERRGADGKTEYICAFPIRFGFRLLTARQLFFYSVSIRVVGYASRMHTRYTWIKTDGHVASRYRRGNACFPAVSLLPLSSLIFLHNPLFSFFLFPFSIMYARSRVHTYFSCSLLPLLLYHAFSMYLSTHTRCTRHDLICVDCVSIWYTCRALSTTPVNVLSKVWIMRSER